jgi:hypothetical protein
MLTSLGYSFNFLTSSLDARPRCVRGMESVSYHPEEPCIDYLADLTKRMTNAVEAKRSRLRKKIIHGPKKQFKAASDGSLRRRSFTLGGGGWRGQEHLSPAVVGTSDTDRRNYLQGQREEEPSDYPQRTFEPFNTTIEGQRQQQRVSPDLVNELDRPGVSARDKVGYDNRPTIVAPPKLKDKLPRPRKRK